MKSGKRIPSYRRFILLGGVVVIAIVCVFTPTYFAGWAPAVHWTCNPSAELFAQVAWTPISLANSPYGGMAFVNATVPPGEFGLGSPGLEVGGGERNGTVWGGFWQVVASVAPLENQTVWGPGTNSRCSARFSVNLQTARQPQVYTGEIFNWPGGPLFGPNSTSDSLEPTSYNLSASVNGSSLHFSNGFQDSNDQSVSTCGGGARLIPVHSTRFTVWVPYPSGESGSAVPFTLPSLESFNYSFPPNFGTWQVDNLSALGGPGGGWAFNYLGPCT